ncbi:hypothetical protein HOY80DRAFT_1084813 [Tuber brumale]|nr:hypothetical protein HOY80DRAFT_1084813 [Tuber brumale]
MSHSDIAIESSNFMPNNANGDSGGSGGGGDIPIVLLSVFASDLTKKRIQINTSKVKEEEPSPTLTGSGDGARDGAGRRLPGFSQNCLSFTEVSPGRSRQWENWSHALASN